MSLIYTYEIRSLVTNKVYYGSTNLNPEKVFKRLDYDLGSHNGELRHILNSEHSKKVVGISKDKKLLKFYIKHNPCVNQKPAILVQHCECGAVLKGSRRRLIRHQQSIKHKKYMEELNAFCLSNISLDIFK